MTATIKLDRLKESSFVSFKEIHYLSRLYTLIVLVFPNISVADSLCINKATMVAVVTDGVGHRVQQVVCEQQVRQGQQTAQLSRELLQTVLRHVQTHQPPEVTQLLHTHTWGQLHTYTHVYKHMHTSPG